MRIVRMLAISLFLLGLIGCGRTNTGGSGYGDGGGGPPIPVDHTLTQSQPVTINAGGFYGFEFNLPTQATFNFSASETTTDTWNVAVFTPAQWVSYQTGSGNGASGGVHNGVKQVNDTVLLPAGDWFLGFRCTNTIQRCMLVFNADAIY